MKKLRKMSTTIQERLQESNQDKQQQQQQPFNIETKQDNSRTTGTS
jgi:hypothetical protein